MRILLMLLEIEDLVTGTALWHLDEIHDEASGQTS